MASGGANATLLLLANRSVLSDSPSHAHTPTPTLMLACSVVLLQTFGHVRKPLSRPETRSVSVSATRRLNVKVLCVVSQLSLSVSVYESFSSLLAVWFVWVRTLYTSK